MREPWKSKTILLASRECGTLGSGTLGSGTLGSLPWGQTALPWGQTEFQVNLILGLTLRSRGGNPNRHR